MKFIGRNTTQNAAEHEGEFASFIAEICSDSLNNPTTWYNADQNGFQKNIHRCRSLESTWTEEN